MSQKIKEDSQSLPSSQFSINQTKQNRDLFDQSHDFIKEEIEDSFILEKLKQDNVQLYPLICKLEDQPKYPAFKDQLFEDHYQLNIFLKRSFKESQNVVKVYTVKRIQKGFEVNLEKGDQKFSIDQRKKESQEKLYIYLAQLSLSKLLCFFENVLNGISELQGKGVYHCDLCLRNIILVGSVFKIIDFDKAFSIPIKQNGEKNSIRFFMRQLNIYFNVNKDRDEHQIRKAKAYLDYLMPTQQYELFANKKFATAQEFIAQGIKQFYPIQFKIFLEDIQNKIEFYEVEIKQKHKQVLQFFQGLYKEYNEKSSYPSLQTIISEFRKQYSIEKKNLGIQQSNNEKIEFINKGKQEKQGDEDKQLSKQQNHDDLGDDQNSQMSFFKKQQSEQDILGSQIASQKQSQFGFQIIKRQLILQNQKKKKRKSLKSLKQNSLFYQELFSKQFSEYILINKIELDDEQQINLGDSLIRQLKQNDERSFLSLNKNICQKHPSYQNNELVYFRKSEQNQISERLCYHCISEQLFQDQSIYCSRHTYQNQIEYVFDYQRYLCRNCLFEDTNISPSQDQEQKLHQQVRKIDSTTKQPLEYFCMNIQCLIHHPKLLTLTQIQKNHMHHPYINIYQENFTKNSFSLERFRTQINEKLTSKNRSKDFDQNEVFLNWKDIFSAALSKITFEFKNIQMEIESIFKAFDYSLDENKTMNLVDQIVGQVKSFSRESNNNEEIFGSLIKQHLNPIIHATQLRLSELFTDQINSLNQYLQNKLSSIVNSEIEKIITETRLIRQNIQKTWRNYNVLEEANQFLNQKYKVISSISAKDTISCQPCKISKVAKHNYKRVKKVVIHTKDEEVHNVLEIERLKQEMALNFQIFEIKNEIIMNEIREQLRIINKQTNINIIVQQQPKYKALLDQQKQIEKQFEQTKVKIKKIYNDRHFPAKIGEFANLEELQMSFPRRNNNLSNSKIECLLSRHLKSCLVNIPSEWLEQLLISSVNIKKIIIQNSYFHLTKQCISNNIATFNKLKIENSPIIEIPIFYQINFLNFSEKELMELSQFSKLKKLKLIFSDKETDYSPFKKDPFPPRQSFSVEEKDQKIVELDKLHQVLASYQELKILFNSFEKLFKVGDFSPTLNNLTDLEINHTSFNQNVGDELLRILKENPMLNKFKISNCTNVPIEIFKSLANGVTAILVEKCTFVNAAGVVVPFNGDDIFKKSSLKTLCFSSNEHPLKEANFLCLKKLQHLYLQESPVINLKTLTTIDKICLSNMTELSLKYCQNIKDDCFDIIAKMNKLRYLNLAGTTADVGLVADLTTESLNYLLLYSCVTLTDEKLRRIMERHANLIQLNIRTVNQIIDFNKQIGNTKVLHNERVMTGSQYLMRNAIRFTMLMTIYIINTDISKECIHRMQQLGIEVIM